MNHEEQLPEEEDIKVMLDILKSTWGYHVAPGIKWRKLGRTEPDNGSEIENTALASALQNKTEFTQTELDEFGIEDLTMDVFIRSGEEYFEPAEAQEKSSHGKIVKEWNDFNSTYNTSGQDRLDGSGRSCSFRCDMFRRKGVKHEKRCLNCVRMEGALCHKHSNIDELMKYLDDIQ